MEPIKVWIDGACAPTNPGGYGGVGVYIEYPDGNKYTKSKGLGNGPKMSNNVAEYAALNDALRELASGEHYNDLIIIHSDLELVVKQVQGLWKAVAGLYINERMIARNLITQFTKLHLEWILREDNYEADLLSKQALQQQGVKV